MVDLKKFKVVEKNCKGELEPRGHFSVQSEHDIEFIFRVLKNSINLHRSLQFLISVMAKLKETLRGSRSLSKIFLEISLETRALCKLTVKTKARLESVFSVACTRKIAKARQLSELSMRCTSVVTNKKCRKVYVCFQKLSCKFTLSFVRFSFLGSRILSCVNAFMNIFSLTDLLNKSIRLFETQSGMVNWNNQTLLWLIASKVNKLENFCVAFNVHVH